jgi:N-methylhydantoinase A
MVAFGGAGPMHAALIAQELEVPEVLVPNVAGAFSAWGMLQTDIRHDASQTYIVPLSQVDWNDVDRRYKELETKLVELLQAEEISPDDMQFARSLDMRYQGQEYFINVVLPETAGSDWRDKARLKELFDNSYEKQYGHKNLAEEVEIVNLRIEAVGKLAAARGRPIAPPAREGGDGLNSKPEGVSRPVVFSGNSRDASFIHRDSLAPGSEWDGPLIVEETSCTTVVPPDFVLRVDEHGNLIIRKKELSA